MGPYYQAFPEGGSLTIYEDDPERTHEQLAKFSKKDADALSGVERTGSEGIAEVMGPLLTQVPPNIGSHRPGDLLDLAKLAWTLRRASPPRMTADVTRLLTMSIADLLDDWFESPQVKGALAVNGVIGTWAGPYEPGTAYVMAHHSIGDVGDGQLGSWGYPEGGMGGVSEAIARSARSFGAEIRTNAKVSRVLVRGGQVRGVVLENGEEILAPLVVTTLHPKIAFLDHLSRNELPDDFVSDIEHWKTRSGVVKINLALSRTAQLHRRPELGHRRAPHRLDRDGADDGVHRGRVPGRPRRQAGARCRSATASSPRRWTRRSIPMAHTSCRCSPSGCPPSGPTSRTPRSSRPTPTG